MLELSESQVPGRGDMGNFSREELAYTYSFIAYYIILLLLDSRLKEDAHPMRQRGSTKSNVLFSPSTVYSNILLLQ